MSGIPTSRPTPRPAGPSRRALLHLSGTALVAAACLLATACAVHPTAPAVAPPARAAVPGFVFSRDTFAFANLVRARHPDVEGLYANYCFVLARGLRQFFLFARFDPAAPRLGHGAYADRVREVVARAPWTPPPPGGDARVLIPGYHDLREFSAAEEAAVKEALGPRFWTLVHWTNWRVTFPVTGGHQEAVADEVMRELAAGRLVQLLVTNWPKPELNHTVVTYEYRATPAAVEFVVWDPNEPEAPGLITFDRDRRRFVATRMFDTEVGVIRVFRMYYSWWM